MISTASFSPPDLSGDDSVARTAKPVSVLVALSAAERACFFPGDGLTDFCPPAPLCWEEWEGMSDAPSTAEWEAMLPRVNPAVILGGWKMPPLTRELLRRCPDLRYVCYLVGSVRKKVDRSFIERGGVVTNWGDEAAPTVAECALMLAMMCLRRATNYALEMHVDRVWLTPSRNPELPRPRSLLGRRVGLHGFGAVARALLRLLEPFGVRVEAFSAPVPASVYAEHGVTGARDLASLYRDNDVVFIVESLTPQTQGCVDEALLGRLRPGSVLVNVARGGLVDEAALARLAARGEVQVGLDVFATEPLPADSPLRGLRNVTLLPHTAGPTIDWYPHCGRRALRNLSAWLGGETPPDAMSLERYDGAT